MNARKEETGCKLTKIGAGLDRRDRRMMTTGKREGDPKVGALAATAPLIYFSKGDEVLGQSLFQKGRKSPSCLGRVGVLVWTEDDGSTALPERNYCVKPY